jgi:hypothetical protein
MTANISVSLPRDLASAKAVDDAFCKMSDYILDLEKLVHKQGDLIEALEARLQALENSSKTINH